MNPDSPPDRASTRLDVAGDPDEAHRQGDDLEVLDAADERARGGVDQGVEREPQDEEVGRRPRDSPDRDALEAAGGDPRDPGQGVPDRPLDGQGDDRRDEDRRVLQEAGQADPAGPCPGPAGAATRR